MNIKELIEKYENELKDVQLKFGANFKTKVFEGVLKDLKQLNEPQKVKVPQCVGDYIEHAKESEWDLEDLFEFVGDQECGGIQKWFYHECNQETLALAWINGYTVVKEKRYLVKMKNIYNHSSMLKLDSITGRWFFGSEKYMCGSLEKHTRKELEQAGFEWVFNCPGIDIEEVEE